jgi:hypothetical protein
MQVLEISCMRKLITVMVTIFLVFSLVAIFSGCEGPMGPPGPEGPQGPPGEDGEDCGDCDDSNPSLTVSSPAFTDAEAGQSYQFTFTASNLPSSLNQVEFGWTFGTGGTGSSGTQQVSVTGGEATHQVSYSYPYEGMFALVVVVEDTQGNLVVEKNLVVTVGEPVEREFDLDVCDTWKAANDGGQGVTVDNWDISMLPSGTEFDIRFYTYNIPDKIVVSYNGSVVLDTGWRGSSSYDGDSMYPGGIEGPGAGQEDGIFTKVTGVDTFEVTVFGPQSGTAWEYDVRARCN